MRTLISVLILAAMFPSLNEAQTAKHSRQPSTNSDQTKLEAQRRYDPLAGQKHLQDGPLDKFLDSINPRDRDFGAIIADAREHLVEQTAENSYFWITLGQSFTILLLVGYIFWLFRQRNDRLEISVNIVTQLANSYLYTRSRAIDAITRHNRLVDDYNALAERKARQDVAEQLDKPASEPQPQILPTPEKNAKENATPAPDSTGTQVFMTKEQINALVEQTKRTATLGKQHQITALTQQANNLREQLHQALARIQSLEKQNRISAGA
jgi:hypothetical protein